MKKLLHELVFFLLRTILKSYLFILEIEKKKFVHEYTRELAICLSGFFCRPEIRRGERGKGQFVAAKNEQRSCAFHALLLGW